MIGKVIGNYKIEKKLGEGGMGAVYQGVDTMLDREVAIKALRPELASQTAIVDRFRSEAVTLAKLNHPNIATLYTMFRHGEELYMVIEFVRGETLDGILQKRGALPAEEVIPVFCQILDGIDHAHELGVIHRDIKPANMMLTEKGTLKVLDFGIARLLGSARMTRAGNIIGTLEYMAPEQVKGAETDARSDIYALGMMLYEVLTGKTPFDTDNEFELMKLQTESMPTPPRELNSEIPEEVEAAIMRAIQKDPDERFQTAGEFRETLLDAGYAAKGVMHGVTGTFTNLNRASAAGVSKSGTTGAKSAPEKSAPKETKIGESIAPPKKAPKETKLGSSVAAVSTGANAAKATRLGNLDAARADSANESQAAASFFSKLTAVHYVGGGVAALILLGLVIAIPAMMLSGGKAKPETEISKPVETKKAAESEKPQVVEMPQQTPQQTQASTITPPVSNDPAPLTPQQPTGNGELKPIETAPAKQTTVAQKPVQTAPKPAAPKPAAPKAAKPKADARCLLTGDC